MKNLFKISTILLATILLQFNVLAQGCIAVRGMACANGNVNNASSFLQAGQFQVSASYRFLHSYKHFVGTEEQTQRVEAGTQVINDSHTLDLGLTYAVSTRFSVTANLPINSNDRSSLYEHYGNAITANPNQLRFHTGSKGIGDLRLSANYWLFDPLKSPSMNISVGVGIKAPTGNSTVIDKFHKLDKDGKDYLVEKFVDQSIQLGDGGWGGSIEVQGYKAFSMKTALYFNGFYLFSPKVINDANLSVPDQFGGRLGLSYALLPQRGISVSLGGRIEGLPAIDAFGSSEGSRRPGFIVSVEPGVVVSGAKNSFSLTVPVAVVRNRTKSYSDLQDPAGLKHGDAAFADYFVSFSVAHRFGGVKKLVKL